MPAPISSSSMILGALIRARPSSRSFFWPPDKVAGLRSGKLAEIEKIERVARGVIDRLLLAPIERMRGKRR